MSLRVNVGSRRGQLAPRRSSGEPVPGAELPAAELRAAAAPPGAGPAGGPAPSPAGGSAPRSVGGQRRRDLLGHGRSVRRAVVLVPGRGAVRPDLLELAVPGPQVRTGPRQKRRADQVAPEEETPSTLARAREV